MSMTVKQRSMPPTSSCAGTKATRRLRGH
jgi:hypothetical protein